MILPAGATSIVLAATEGVSGTTAGWSSAFDSANGYTVFSWSVEVLGAGDFYYIFLTGLVSAVIPGGDNGVGKLWRWTSLRSVCRIVRFVDIYVLGRKS
jgi:hypothetical protein